jgi:hypothetical protein
VGGRVFARALDVVERIGNRLPDPITIFVILALVVLAGSWLAARLGVSAVHPKDGSVITAVNLLNAEGVRRIFTEAVRNFMNFAPLGIVLTAMIGIGVAEKTGLIAVSLRAFMTGVPRTLLTAAVIFAGMMAHLAADAGIIILPPIAALLFAAAGRHPLAGFIAAYAAVSGAFSANVLPSPRRSSSPSSTGRTSVASSPSPARASSRAWASRARLCSWAWSSSRRRWTPSSPRPRPGGPCWRRCSCRCSPCPASPPGAPRSSSASVRRW